jgi:hypothetical protein
LKDDSWFTDLFDRKDYPVRAVTKEDIDSLEKEIDELTAKASGGARRRALGVVPRDW